MDDLVTSARRMLATNQYLTLATADASGRPWASTVWYAARDRSRVDAVDLQLVWLSRPEARHSQNLLDRPEVGISIFDSSQPAGTGDGLQLEGTAELVPDDELDALIAVFSEASLAAGGTAWDRERVTEPNRLRLYVARPRAAYVIGDSSRLEIPVA